MDDKTAEAALDVIYITWISVCYRSSFCGSGGRAAASAGLTSAADDNGDENTGRGNRARLGRAACRHHDDRGDDLVAKRSRQCRAANNNSARCAPRGIFRQEKAKQSEVIKPCFRHRKDRAIIRDIVGPHRMVLESR
jgi:hypothetical protein